MVLNGPSWSQGPRGPVPGACAWDRPRIGKAAEPAPTWPPWRATETVGQLGRGKRRVVGAYPCPRRRVDDRHVRTEAGDPLQLGTDPADRACQYHRLRRAAPLAPVHGRKLWIEVCHGHVVTLLHRGDGEMQGRAWFSRRPPSRCRRQSFSSLPPGSACAQVDRVLLVHTLIIGCCVTRRRGDLSALLRELNERYPLTL